MNQERWQQVEAILQAALDVESSAERARLVAESSAGDDELRAAVERLLAAEDEAESFIESAAWARPAAGGTRFERAPADSAAPDCAAGGRGAESNDLIGVKIGAFELTRELGRGGMGAVYLAERADGEFRQKVAVKLIKRGMDTDFIVRRFRRERQILAALDHPNIARLLDGGTTDDGAPYFVMEYAEGETLYRFCDGRRLATTERLRLFRKICAAVEAAHRLKIVHRDLKPSNVVVKANGAPKLLDFGIAKLLDPNMAAATLEPTATAMRLMTPEYAAPEQVRGEAVSPTSDVYSLGVVLYELLTGHRPYSLKKRALHEIARVICEEEPLAPSAVLSRADDLVPDPLETGAADGEEAPPARVFAARRTDLEALRRELAGDLDAIILKALRKNPVERYRSVAELSADAARFLERRPVAAESFAPKKSAGKAPVAPSTPPVNDMPTAFPRVKTVAVLPLRTMRGAARGASDDFLGIGLTDAILMRLSNVPRLIVRPTSSVLRYNTIDVEPFEAGRELKVEYIVDGSVRQSGEKIRVSIQLLNVAEKSTVWAHHFDEKSLDVLELEDAISARVAESLVPQLSGVERRLLEKRGTNAPAAQEAYLRGRFYWNRMTADGFAKSIEFYNRAIDFDSSFAAAYAGIAEYYSWMAVYGLLAPKESLAKARAAAEKALALDVALAEAHAARGLSLLTHETQWALSGVHFRQAVELNRNSATAHILYACQLAMEARFDEALREAERARALDPLNPFNRYILAWCFYQARRYDESIAENLRLIEDEPLYSSAYFTLSWSLRRAGRTAEAVAAARRGAELAGGAIPMMRAALAAALAENGEPEAARGVLAELDDSAEKSFVTPLHRALVHLHLGETERALTRLAEAVEARDPWTVWLGTEPQLDGLRGEPRFQALLRRAKSPFAA
ncbi:MAG TPA: protein kinase [Pyrinomonadaceae bacterium]|jgi:serine/threonine protein kinase/tetratricopeptide (TPR) repeat protein